MKLERGRWRRRDRRGIGKNVRGRDIKRWKDERWRGRKSNRGREEYKEMEGERVDCRILTGVSLHL